jgi:hypothetical protein
MGVCSPDVLQQIIKKDFRRQFVVALVSEELKV